MAKTVLNHGHCVVMTARNTESQKALANHFLDTAHLATVDVTDPKDVLKVVEEAEREFGKIDVLVNNAGIGYSSAQSNTMLPLRSVASFIVPLSHGIKHKRLFRGHCVDPLDTARDACLSDRE
ncbi:NAD(P)-dependent dehydrogenase (short-subunit alcohol dehydrogenase family) [Paenibacillus endophyticus]|uniref:NAD(P)-dependent dehydrogenase (Short-subunit alcohol dehydrogenase family) n=1 Tax=Paenibacillus endophyticus TaxID=1294268 RepID=A0A7W5CDV7_9BACL|nr:SDR family NAD(P)-dependent oxidoreductase [Paenibacillus endophyticus]MBB3155881.1 NAD(P)-dependent dehydrogenase (short-subunit alcohol dehydrogenase family) [Paenibacillus endophyticus]